MDQFPRIAREALKLGSWEVPPDEVKLPELPGEILARHEHEIATLKANQENMQQVLLKVLARYAKEEE